MIKLFLLLLGFLVVFNLFAFYVIAIRINLPFLKALKDFFWTANYWRILFFDIFLVIGGTYSLYEEKWTTFFFVVLFFNVYLFPKILQKILNLKEYYYFEKNFKKDLEVEE